MPDAVTTTRTKSGCQNCRLRHVKCDDKQPGCSRCAQSGIECIRRLNVRFCHNLNPTIATEKGPEEIFHKSQIWVPTQGALSFVDETRDTIAIYETNPAPYDVPSQRRPSTSSVKTSLDQSVIEVGLAKKPPIPPWDVRGFTSPFPDPSDESQSDLPTKRRRMTNDGSTFSTFTPRSDSIHSPSIAFGSIGEFASPGQSLRQPTQDPSPRPISSHELFKLAEGDRSSATPARSRPPGGTFSSTQSFGTISTPYPESKTGLIDDPTEARLLRHFVENLASLFDLTDSLSHFRNVIPQRALHDPILLTAVLAASARHLSRTSNLDPYVADKYHQECIQHLIPRLNDETSVWNEDLLASTVILRYLEEIDVPISGQLHPDNSGHLIGTHVFISAQESSAMLGGLRLAAFWVGLRQEIYVAFVNQRSIIPPLQHCNIDRSFDPADDGTWANRIIVHCAETIRYCFGLHEHERTTTRYLELMQYCEDWLKYTPPSYTPVFYREAGPESVFPEIMYLSDATVTGIQHYHLTLILLHAHDPRIPTLGPRRLAALRKMDNEIRYHVRMLCALAESNRSTPPNFVTASMAIAMAGDKFTDVEEQEACLRILNTCEADFAWPTRTAREDLKLAWGWIEAVDS